MNNRIYKNYKDINSEMYEDINKLRDAEKFIDEKFGDKELWIFYSEYLTKEEISYINKLPEKELPNCSIVFPSDNAKKFLIINTDIKPYTFTKNHEPNDIATIIKAVVIDTPQYFKNNHISIMINNSKQLDYINSLKERFDKIKEYLEKEKY